jgi:hypothetical protein
MCNKELYNPRNNINYVTPSEAKRFLAPLPCFHDKHATVDEEGVVTGELMPLTQSHANLQWSGEGYTCKETLRECFDSFDTVVTAVHMKALYLQQCAQEDADEKTPDLQEISNNETWASNIDGSVNLNGSQGVHEVNAMITKARNLAISGKTRNEL